METTEEEEIELLMAAHQDMVDVAIIDRNITHFNI